MQSSTELPARHAVDAGLVRRMIDRQFPQWSSVPLRPIEPGGWDNRAFRLGEGMVVRLPTASEYAAQVPKEQQWLPKLAPRLPFAIPKPLAWGQPMFDYPWQWSVYSWIDGAPASAEPSSNLPALAADLARFLAALQAVDAAGGPRPGPDNFFRGGSLAVYDPEVRRAISILDDSIDAARVTALWDEALESTWNRPAVWVHGDISPGNLLTRGGRLTGVIDFGCMAVGDPACDLAIAWTFFSGESRHAFVASNAVDSTTWARARGWALWKGLIIAAGLARTNAAEWGQPFRVIETLAT